MGDEAMLGTETGHRPPVEGRWCGYCGGELKHVRRREAAQCEIVTYLRCGFCMYAWPILAYDIITQRLRVLWQERVPLVSGSE